MAAKKCKERNTIFSFSPSRPRKYEICACSADITHPFQPDPTPTDEECPWKK
jgi:hypothetical protein